MNKIEFQQHLDEILQMIANGRYTEAVEACDELNLDQLRSPKDLQKIAKAYEKCRRYADAEDILLQARERAPRSRSTLFHLCTVAVKAGDLESAHAYYNAFSEVAPDDKERYVLQYRIAMKEEAPVDELIRILETAREGEPDDKWMLELARLYAGVGDTEKCLGVIDEIEMWFDGGKYVEAAQELKRRIGEGDSFEGVLPKTRENSVIEDETGDLELPENLQMKAEADEAGAADGSAEKTEGTAEASEEPEEEEVPVRSAEPVRRNSRGEPRQRRGFSFFGKNTEDSRREKQPPARKETERIKESEKAAESTVRPPVDRRREMELTGDSWIPAWTGHIPDVEGDPDLTDAGISRYSTPAVTSSGKRRSGKDDSWAFTMDVGSATPERTGRIIPVSDEEEARYYARGSRPSEEAENDSRYAKSGSYKAERSDASETEEKKAPKKDYDDYTAALGVVPDSVYDKDLEDSAEREAKEKDKNRTADAPERKAEDPVAQAIEAPDEHVTIKVRGPVVQKTVEYESVSFDTLHTPDIAEGISVVSPDEAAEMKEKLPAEENGAEAEKPVPPIDMEMPKDLSGKKESAEASGETASSVPVRPSQEPLPDDYGLSPEELDARVTEQDLKARKKANLEQFRTLPIEPEIDKTIWHFLVIGDNPELTLECARERMKEMSEIYPNGPKKMLKIIAEKIGDASIVNSLDRFLGNMVIVQHPSILQDWQLREFAKILDKDDRSLLVAFTDRRSAIADVLRRVPELFDSFTAVFEGRTYTARDLVEIAKEYLLKEDAKLSRDAQVMVYDEARRLIQEHTGYYRNKIRAFVKAALERADSGGFLGLGGGRFDKNGYLIITAKHFK